MTSARTPWHKHKFTGGQMTPKSCIVCSGKKDAPQHQLEPPVEDEVSPLPVPEIGIEQYQELVAGKLPEGCWRCQTKDNLQTLSNGAILCPGCIEILRP